MNGQEAHLDYPCVRNCCLDNDDICLGCFRTLQEILGWNEADEPTRRAILALAEQRREAHRKKWGSWTD